MDGLGLLAVDRRPVGRRGRRLGPGARAAAIGPSDPSWRRPPPAAAGGRSAASRTAPSGSRPRRASCPAGRGRGSTGPSGPGRGRRPGRRPRHAARRPGAAGRRPAPSARAGPPARRRRPRRPGHAAGDVPLQELAVGQPGDRAALEERPELPDHGPRCHTRHTRSLSFLQ